MQEPPSLVGMLRNALHDHIPVGASPENRYKTTCSCGERWYDFDHHRARVAATTVTDWLEAS